MELPEAAERRSERSEVARGHLTRWALYHVARRIGVNAETNTAVENFRCDENDSYEETLPSTTPRSVRSLLKLEVSTFWRIAKLFVSCQLGSPRNCNAIRRFPSLAERVPVTGQSSRRNGIIMNVESRAYHVPGLQRFQRRNHQEGLDLILLREQRHHLWKGLSGSGPHDGCYIETEHRRDAQAGTYSAHSRRMPERRSRCVSAMSAP